MEAVPRVPPPPRRAVEELEEEEVHGFPLTELLDRDDVVYLEKLLSRGLDVNSRSSSESILTNAFISRSIKCAKLLLDRGGSSSITTAILCGDSEDLMLQMLIEHGYKFESPALEAAYRGDVATLEKMSVDELLQKDKEEYAAIHYAACGGSVNALKCILDRLPSSIHEKGGQRLRTPLHLAAFRERIDAMEFLLQKGASIVEEDGQGNTCLMGAARRNRLKSVRYLVENKHVDVNAFSTEGGNTALRGAARAGCFEVVEYLLSKGADPNPRTLSDSYVPLIHHQLGGVDFPDITRLLFAHGAEPSSGNSLLLPALKGGNIHIVNYLLSEQRVVLTPCVANINAAIFSRDIGAVKWLLERGHELKENEMDEKKLSAMFYAVLGASLPMIRWLHKRGHSYKGECDGYGLLQVAVRVQDADIVREILKSGECDINFTDHRGVTALMQALEATSDEIVDLLLAAGSHFEGSETASGATVFLLACKRGRLDLVQRMVAERPACINDRQLNGVGPVFYATHKVSVLKWLLHDRKLSPNETSQPSNTTALMFAAVNGYVETLQLLLDAGADLHVVTNDNCNALHFACKGGNVEAVKLLIQRGLSYKAGSPIVLAIEADSIEVVRYFIEELHVDPNEEHMNITPLMRAARSGALRVARYLCETANVNRSARDSEGATALIYAAFGGSIPMLQYLLDRGAKLTERTKNDLTALHMAVRCSNFAMVNYLISKGFDCKASAAISGYSPAITGAFYQQTAMVRWLLLKKQAHVAEKSKHGLHLIHAAAESNDVELLELILNEAPDEASVVDKNGTLPIDRAAAGTHLEALRLLVKRGPTLHILEDDFSTLCIAALKGRLDCVRCLLWEGKPTIEEVNAAISHLLQAKFNKAVLRELREYVFLSAARQGLFEMVCELHERKGVSLSCADDEGRTAWDLTTSDEIKAYLRPPKKEEASMDGFQVALLTILALARFFGRN